MSLFSHSFFWKHSWKQSSVHQKQSPKQIQKQRQAGFTLLELMVVAAILVMLASVAVPQLLNAYEDARLQKLEVDAKQVLNTLNRVVLDDRLKGGGNADITLTLSNTVLASTYGLELSDVSTADFTYDYAADTTKSYVSVAFNGRTYRTDRAADGWQTP